MSSPSIPAIFLGISISGHAVRVASSLGQRSSIASERLRSADDWVELATYGIPLPEKHSLLACVALPSGYPREEREKIINAARLAGWDGVLVVNSLQAAGRALRAREKETEDLAIVAVGTEVTSVGLLRGKPLGLVDHDPVHPIRGREAREVAVSLRCMLKQQARDRVRTLLRRVMVVGEAGEIERVGRRQFEREIEALGAQKVEFELDPFLICSGAVLIAQATEKQTWRRIRRRWK